MYDTCNGILDWLLRARSAVYQSFREKHLVSLAPFQGGFAYDGLGDGLPVVRVDKDSVADMGTVWEYTNRDGTPCCPVSARPTVANKAFQIAQSSNCIDGGCYNPDADTADTCTWEYPCAGYTLSGVTTVTGGLSIALNTLEFSGSTANILDGIYTGFTIYFSSALVGTGSNAGVTNTASGFCGNASETLPLVFSLPSGAYGGGAVGTVTLDGTGSITANSAVVIDVGQGYTVAPIVTCLGCWVTCTAIFTAKLKVPTIAGTSKTIIGYQSSTRTAYLDSVHATLGGASASDVYYRISADGISRSSTD